MYGWSVFLVSLLVTQSLVHAEQDEDIIENSDTVGGYMDHKEYDPAGDKNHEDKEEQHDKVKRINPCKDLNCDAGYECTLDEDLTPSCSCVRKCIPEPEDARLKICTTQNVTYESECDFDRARCLCQTNDAMCDQNRYLNAHLDYFGPCIELPKCKDEELEEFPKRMREWLFLIMEELDRRNDLNPAAHKMVEEAKEREHPWVLPVIWKFCDLDSSHDRSVSLDELLAIQAPLKPMEQCTAPFLEKCDSNNDGTITLNEWGSCLGLEEEEIEDRCDSLQD